MSHTILIIATCGDFAATVFFYEITVSLTIFIATFETLAIFGFLYTLSVTYSFVELPSKAVSIVIVYDNLTLELSCPEVTFEDIAIFLGELAMPILHILAPKTVIDVAIVPAKHSLSRPVAVEECTVVGIAGYRKNGVTYWAMCLGKK